MRYPQTAGTIAAGLGDLNSLATTDRKQLLEDALGQLWFHTIDLGDGNVTPGVVDVRDAARKILPEDLAGQRAVDFGTFDGFWAFALERRGADVTAVDLESFAQTEFHPYQREERLRAAGDDAPGTRFPLAHALLESNVTKVHTPIYDVTTDMIGGPVDLAFIGALTVHLQDPVRGLEAVKNVIKPGGRIILVDEISVKLSLLRPRQATAELRAMNTTFDWWVANMACLRDWLRVTGFTDVQRGHVFRLKAAKKDRRTWHATYTARA